MLYYYQFRCINYRSQKSPARVGFYPTGILFPLFLTDLCAVSLVIVTVSQEAKATGILRINLKYIDADWLAGRKKSYNGESVFI